MRLGYADPPYPGQAKRHYGNHPDYAGEVDHVELLKRLDAEYDGWVLHTSSTALADVLGMAANLGITDYRIMAWVKPFAAFKPNVPVAYAWEPVLIKAARKPVVAGATGVMRDWKAENITLKRGLTGVKPEAVCWWLFDCLGALPGDNLDDLYIGSGAVSSAWITWCNRRNTPSIPGEVMPPKKKTTDEPTAPAAPDLEPAASPLVETALGGAARSTLRATSPIVAEIARVIEFHSSTGGEASRIAQALRDVFGEISRAADAATHKRPANRAAPELFHLNPPALRWLAALARVWAPAEPEPSITGHTPAEVAAGIAEALTPEPESAEPLTVAESPAPPVPDQAAIIAEFERQLIIERAPVDVSTSAGHVELPGKTSDPFTEPAPLDTFASPAVREAIGLDPWMLPAATLEPTEYEALASADPAPEPAPATSAPVDDIPF